MVDINHMRLNSKEHIRKYHKLRELYGKVLDSLSNYPLNGHYDAKQYNDMNVSELKSAGVNIKFDFDINNREDLNIYTELFVYKNHPEIKPIKV